MPPEVFLKLVLNHVTSCYSSSHPWAPLMVLAAMLESCPSPLLQPHLEQIINTLVRPDVCQDYQQVRKEEWCDFFLSISPWEIYQSNHNTSLMHLWNHTAISKQKLYIFPLFATPIKPELLLSAKLFPLENAKKNPSCLAQLFSNIATWQTCLHPWPHPTEAWKNFLPGTIITESHSFCLTTAWLL